MRTILHILTRPADEFVNNTIQQQRTFPETAVDIVDLTEPSPNYGSLVEKIFAADSIDVF